MPIFLVRGVAEALAHMQGPVILVANLLTEGRGMGGFTAADAVAWLERAIERRAGPLLFDGRSRVRRFHQAASFSAETRGAYSSSDSTSGVVKNTRWPWV